MIFKQNARINRSSTYNKQKLVVKNFWKQKKKNSEKKHEGEGEGEGVVMVEEKEEI